MKFHWFRRQRREDELDAELRHHLDEAIRDRMARGEAPDEARANALREFGNVGLVKEVTADCWISGNALRWAVFAQTDKPLEEVTPLYSAKHRLRSGKQVLTVRTTKRPGRGK